MITYVLLLQRCEGNYGNKFSCHSDTSVSLINNLTRKGKTMNIDVKKARLLFNRYATPVCPNGCLELDFDQFYNALKEYMNHYAIQYQVLVRKILTARQSISAQHYHAAWNTLYLNPEDILNNLYPNDSDKREWSQPNGNNNITRDDFTSARIILSEKQNLARDGNHSVWYRIFGKLTRETENEQERNKPNTSGKIGLPLDAPEMSMIRGHSMLSVNGRWVDKLYLDGELIAQWIEPQPTDAEAMA